MAEAARIPAGPKIREWSRKRGFDDWMVARFAKLIAESDVPKGSLQPFLDGLGIRPPTYLRAHPLRGKPSITWGRLEARGFQFEPVGLDADMRRVMHAPISAGATQEHLLGMTTPQDLASASVGLALQAGRGDVVADLAAAPGIKTLHAAGNEPGATFVAVEPDPTRMRALQFNLERCGLANVVTRQHTAQELPGEAWADKVLLDAPCTGEGTLPKDRNRRRGTPDEIGRLSALQEEIIDAADRVLKPGGRLVYATCTFAPEENEAHVQRLIERGYTVEALPFDRCGPALASGVTHWPGLELDASMRKTKRFLPGIHNTLGFYVASLRKGDA